MKTASAATPSAADVEAAATGEVRDPAAYVPALDGVRAFAILAVFLLHLDGALFSGGAIGVDVFFALSAYLITGILLHERAEGPLRFADFYWRRAFRLVPALLLWAVLIATPTAISAHRGSSIPVSLAGSLLYSNDFLQAWTSHVSGAFDQSWSLAVEEQFYLLWPAVLVLGVWRLHRKGQAVFFAALASLAVVVLFEHSNYFLPTGHLVPLVLGSWAAWWTSTRSPKQLPALIGRVAAVGASILLVTAVFLTPRAGWRESLWSAVLAGAAVAVIVHVDADRRSPIARILGARVPRWLGSRSYGIYLYGLTAIQLVGNVTQLPLRYAGPLSVVVVVIVSEVSYRYVEAPIRVAGRRWLKSRRTASEEPVQPPSVIEILPPQWKGA